MRHPEVDTAGRKTVVLGLGNPIVSDDAVGLHVVDAIRQILGEPLPDGLEVRTSQRAGFELVELLAGFDHAIIVDCLELPDPVPGRVRQLTLEDVAGSVRLVGVHEVTIGHAFSLGRITGVKMPDDVVIYAIEGQDMHTVGETMTPPVSAAVDPLAREIVELWMNEGGKIPGKPISHMTGGIR